MNEKALERLEYGKIKEELLTYAVSYLGKRHIEQMTPMTSVKWIRSRLDETAEAKELLKGGASVPIPSLEGIEPILALLGTGYVCSERDFMHLQQFIRSCEQLIKYMAAKRQAAPNVSSYAASMYALETLKSELDRCIRHGKVADEASKELLKARKRIQVAEGRLKSKLDALIGKHRSIMQEHVVSTRSGRYVLPIKKEHRKLIQGAVLDESASGQTVYIEPAEIANLQYELSALKAEEVREELKVLSELTALAESFSQPIEINVETIGMYDFLFAKAKYAMAIGGANIELNEEGKMRLKSARHPLLGEKMVPLDFAIGYRYRSLIITGPNTGGKTLALKTVGLLTAMVQSGLLVPVQEGSLFAVFDNITADIGDGQSIEHALSTFSAHIRNVIDILKTAGSSTLVLIDEMATGTDPGEGVGLSVAILEELHRRGATVVATTHFSEIKNFAAAAEGFENARMEFDTESLQPLYRLRIGEAGQSYAFYIALKLGIPAEIVERSRAIAVGGLVSRQPAEGGTAMAEGGTAEAERGTMGAEGGTAEAGSWTMAEGGTTEAESWTMAKGGTAEAERGTIAEADTGGAAASDANPSQFGESDESCQGAKPGTSATPGSPGNPGQPAASGEPKTRPRSFQLGDRVHIPYLGRSGVVYETEDARGQVGVMIQQQKLKIHKKRLKLHIENKELYPDNYDFDIVFDTKENRRKRKLMHRKHVEGLIIETKPDDGRDE